MNYYIFFCNLIPVDDLIAKHGEGQTFVRQSILEYKQDIRLEGGIVAVLSTEDDFFVPNCDSNQSSSEASHSG